MQKLVWREKLSKSFTSTREWQKKVYSQIFYLITVIISSDHQLWIIYSLAMNRAITSVLKSHDAQTHHSILTRVKIQKAVKFCDAMNILYFKKTFFEFSTSQSKRAEKCWQEKISVELDIMLTFLKLVNVIQWWLRDTYERWSVFWRRRTWRFARWRELSWATRWDLNAVIVQFKELWVR
jgi:hypothetical protein